MTCRLARRLRSALASTLAAALIVFSPGLEAPRLFAQMAGRSAPVEGARVLPVLPAAAPAASGASILAVPSFAAPAAIQSAPAAALSETAQAIAPQIEVLSNPQTGADASRGAGDAIIDAITGQKSSGAGEAPAVAGQEGSGAPALSALSAADFFEGGGEPRVPAAPSPSIKTIDSPLSYRLHRLMLKAVAALTGAVYSLPVAGPAITRHLIDEAASKRVAVFSDFDDTLASYNEVLPAEMVEAVKALRAAGKDFVVISDRGDEPRAHQLTVFESLSSLPVELRAGMYVAANSGGRVYRYDEKGEPVRVFEAPVLDEASKAKTAAAAEATKARLKEIGAEVYVPDATSNAPSETWNAYGYALMLKVGSSEAQVRGAAEILQGELAKRGLNVEVAPRFAKNPANPPYVKFDIITKQASASYIAQALKVSSRDVLVIGDSMYAPHEAKRVSWLTRLGRRLSGREIPQTGNATDRNMEKALPGALTLSVGTTGDPRASNLWVLDGKGPSLTRRVLMSMASKPRARDKGLSEDAVAGIVFVGALAALAAGGYMLYSAFSEIARQGEEMLRDPGASDSLMMIGGTLGLSKMFARPSTPSLKESASAGSVSDLTSFIYDTALESAREHAASLGAPSQSLRVLAASLSPRRWGEDWTFRFAVPRPGTEFSRGFDVTVRRTTVAETLVDAVALKETGHAPYLRGVPAEDFASQVAVEPMKIISESGPSARTLALESRHGVSGLPEMFYVTRDGRGREVQVVQAKTGVNVVEERSSLLLQALFILGALGLLALVYGAIFYAAAHAPAASGVEIPEGWQGPIPDIGMMFGLAGVTAAAKGKRAPAPKMTEDQIRSAAKYVASQKGLPYSQTEYSMAYSETYDSLKAGGATKAQLKLFEKLCAEAPVQGGRFNQWSGD